MPLTCPNYWAVRRIIAFIIESMAVHDILAHLDEPTSPPRMAPVRGPPLWEMSDAAPIQCDLQADPCR